MTTGHLLLGLATTSHIAIQLEEHDLIQMFCERYRCYRQQVAMLRPPVNTFIGLLKDTCFRGWPVS
jgi:protein-S-isoprenylcysteine O-methyltransferase Ste14